MVLYPVQIPPVPQASPFPGFNPKSSRISQLRVGTSCFSQVIPKNIERTHSSTRTLSQEISLFRVILCGKQAAKQATEKPHILCSMYPKVACNLQHTIFWWCLPLSPGWRPLCGGPIPVKMLYQGTGVPCGTLLASLGLAKQSSSNSFLINCFVHLGILVLLSLILLLGCWKQPCSTPTGDLYRL